ncbi:uncharacterized protein LOC144439274 [Glandiceps talaboti]
MDYQQCLNEVGFATFSSLVKEELRNSIKKRRLSKGLPDVQIDYKTPEQDELTEEEKGKRKIRRERNRLAAEKCRMKRKESETSIVKEYKDQEKLQQKLKKTIKELEEEKELLTQALQAHNKDVTQCKLFKRCR